MSTFKGLPLQEYRPGRTNVADPVSRRPSDQYPVVTIGVTTRSLKAANSQPDVPASPPDVMVTDSEPVLERAAHIALREKMIQGYTQDPWFAYSSNVSQLVSKHGLYWKHSSVALPDHADLRQQLMHELHNTPCAGHLGVSRTTSLFSTITGGPHQDLMCCCM